MTIFHCNCKNSCTLGAVIVSLILGVLAAFLQITAVIAVTPVFLWVALGVTVAALDVLAVTTTLARRAECSTCLCSTLALC